MLERTWTRTSLNPHKPESAGSRQIIPWRRVSRFPWIWKVPAFLFPIFKVYLWNHVKEFLVILFNGSIYLTGTVTPILAPCSCLETRRKHVKSTDYTALPTPVAGSFPGPDHRPTLRWLFASIAFATNLDLSGILYLSVSWNNAF